MEATRGRALSSAQTGNPIVPDSLDPRRVARAAVAAQRAAVHGLAAAVVVGRGERARAGAALISRCVAPGEGRGERQPWQKVPAITVSVDGTGFGAALDFSIKKSAFSTTLSRGLAETVCVCVCVWSGVMRWSAAEEAFLRLRVVDGCLCYGVMGSRLLEKSAFGTVSKILFHAFFMGIWDTPPPGLAPCSAAAYSAAALGHARRASPMPSDLFRIAESLSLSYVVAPQNVGFGRSKNSLRLELSPPFFFRD